MSFETFLAWEAEQEEKWELVDGVPIRRSWRCDVDPTTGMAGGSYRHADIAANIVAALRTRLRGSPCRAVGSDLKVVTAAGNARYPDVLVDCSPVTNALFAPEPKVVFEVLSPSNKPVAQLRMIADYQGVATLQHIVFVEQGRPALIVWNRRQGPWSVIEFLSLDDILPLPAIGAELSLAEIYEGLTFELIPANG